MKSLRQKLVAIMLTMLVMVSGYFVLFAILTSLSTTTDVIGKTYPQIVRALAGQMAAQVDAYKAQMDAVAKGPVAIRGMLPTARSEEMRRQSEIYGFTYMAVSDVNGKALASDGTELDLLGYDCVKEALATEKTIVSDPLPGKTTGALSYAIAAPYYQLDKLAGVIFTEVDYGAIGSAFDTINFSPDTQVFVVNGAGKIVLAKSRAMVEKNIHFTEALGQSSSNLEKQAQEIEQMKPAYTEITLNGSTSCLAYTPITGTNWSLVMETKKTEFLASFYRSITMVLVSVILCLALGSVAAVIISKRIAAPVSAVSQRLDKLSKGDLQTEVPKVKSKDEIGVLAKSLEGTVATWKTYISSISGTLGSIAQGDMTAQPQIDYIGDFEPIEAAMRHITNALNETMQGISDTSEQVSTGSEQLSSGVQALAQSASEEVGTIEKLSSAVSEISLQIQNNATSATKVYDKAMDVGSQLEESGLQIQRMTSTMSEISDSSREIKKIIKTIEDIAMQTNILALNASIEAARAGLAGRGFSIVADEVRRLAAKSTEAAAFTSQMINKSFQAVETGAQIAGETEQRLFSVVESASYMVDSINEITRASELQAEFVLKITHEMEQISSMVQVNSATVQQSAASSEELGGQAQMLRGMTAKFKLKGVSPESESALKWQYVKDDSPGQK